MNSNASTNFNLTDKQDGAFKELKSRILNNYGPKDAEDYRIYRFLKARNFSVQQAEDMLVKHLQWRKEFEVDTILEDFKISEVLKKYVQVNMMGFDVEGHVNMYLKVGALDFRGLAKSEKKSNVLKYAIYFMAGCEKLLKEQSHKLGQPIETWSIIFDMENCLFFQALHKSTVETILPVLLLYEANYPERLKTAYVINATMPFYIVYNAVKYILSAATVRKFMFFGKDGWKEELLKLMDPHELPAFLGGNRTDPDGNELCLTTINHCGTIPEYYYFRNPKRRLSAQLDIKTYTLGRKGKVDILLQVEEPESSIEWEFETENNDIAYGLLFRGKIGSEMKPIPLIPIQRTNTHKEIESGRFKCSKPGIYILTLDNSYSWFRQKKIYCRTSVVLPSEKEKNTVAP